MKEARATFTILGSGTSEGVPRVSCLTKRPFPTCETCISASRRGSHDHRRNTSGILVVSRNNGENNDISANKKSYNDTQYHNDDDNNSNNDNGYDGYDNSRSVNILIDCGKRFWEGAIEHFPRLGVRHIDAVVLTHDHADASNGLDDLRDFTKNIDDEFHGNNSSSNSLNDSVDDGEMPSGRTLPIPVYARASDLESISKAFPYLVNKSEATGGGQVPSLDFRVIPERGPFSVLGVEFNGIPVEHGKLPGGEPYYCQAYSFGDTLYVSDCNYVPKESVDQIRKLRRNLANNNHYNNNDDGNIDGNNGDKSFGNVFIDALRPEKIHPSHFSLTEAVSFVSETVGNPYPEATFTVGMCHDFNHEIESRKLKENEGERGFHMDVGYDGLSVDVKGIRWIGWERIVKMEKDFMSKSSDEREIKRPRINIGDDSTVISE